MKILIGMSFSATSPLSEEFSKQFEPGASSTVFSSLKRLMQNGVRPYYVFQCAYGKGITHFRVDEVRG